MKNKILFITFLFSLSVYSQENKIVYIFPDSVEIAVNEYITQERKEKTSYYLVLSKDTANVYKLMVSSYDPSYDSTHRANVSNRVAVINDKHLPLLFDYDERFGTLDAINIGRHGERDDGYVKRSITIYDWHYTIYFIGDFKDYGTILKKGFF